MKLKSLWLYLCLPFSGFCQSVLLTPTAMQQDIDILYETWISLHPGLFRYQTAESLDADFADLRNFSSTPRTEVAFYVRLAQLTTKVKCGHTYLNPFNLDSVGISWYLPESVMPFLFAVTNKKEIIITHNLSDDAHLDAGTKIIAINGVPAEQIIDSMLTVSRSDGNNGLGKQLNNISITPDEINNYSLFDIFYPKFFNHGTSVIEISGMQYFANHIFLTDVPMVKHNQREDLYVNKYGLVPKSEDGWVYQVINPTTAYMKFSTFAFWNSTFDPKTGVDSFFNLLLASPEIDKLIIDIRGNEGGDNTGEYILSYLTDKQLPCYNPDHPCYKYVHVPNSLLPYLETWDRTFKLDKDTSLFFKNELGLYEYKEAPYPCADIHPQKHTFHGKTILLTDAKNSSAGFEMARNMRDYQLATIIGEPTGGTQQGINGGEFFFVQLPNSHIEIDQPLIFNYHPGKPDSGIVPDILSLETWESIAKGKDLPLATAIEYLNR